jgi:hypothetical protein
VHHVKINNPILIKRFSLFCMFVKDYNFFLFGFDCIYSFKITISFYLALTVFIVSNPLIVWSWCSCLFCFYWLVNSVQHQSVIALLAIPFSWLIPTLACRLNLENVNLVALLNQDNVKVNFFTSYLMHAYIYHCFIWSFLKKNLNVLIYPLSGHFGYIDLPVPIYHPSHISELKRMLSLLCLKCLKLKRNKVFPIWAFHLFYNIFSNFQFLNKTHWIYMWFMILSFSLGFNLNGVQ